jgi:hypothetical protein
MNNIKCIKTHNVVMCEDDQSSKKYYQIEKNTKSDKQYNLYNCGSIDNTFKNCAISDNANNKPNNVIYTDVNTKSYSIAVNDGEQSYYFMFDNAKDLSGQIIRKLTSNADIAVIQLAFKSLSPDTNQFVTNFAEGITQDYNNIENMSPDDLNKDMYYFIIIRENNNNTPNVPISTDVPSVVQNLQWASNKCWADVVLVNFFYYITPLSTRIINNLNTVDTVDTVDIKNFFKELLSGKNKKSISNIANNIIFMGNKDNQLTVNKINSADGNNTSILLTYFDKASMGSSLTMIYLMNYLFKLFDNTNYFKIIRNSQQLEILNNPDYFCIDLSADIYPNGEMQAQINTYINKQLFGDYILTTAIVALPGHYVSIIYDTTTKSYKTINKLKNTQITDTTLDEWKLAKYLFYYKTSDIVNTLTKEKAQKTLSQKGGATDIYFKKYIKYKSKYMTLKNKLIT